jgi:hypothetical protein
MTGHGAKFGRKREDAIVALLTQRNIEEAAKSVGIGTKTLLRWLKIPEFEAAYRAARTESVRQAIARVQQTTSAAVSTLHRLMVDANTPASVRARVSETILTFAIKGVETEDILARLEQLERATEESKQSR